MKEDKVNHPKHYTQHPSGVECIDIVEHFGFNLGSAMKYIWRADLKDNALEDLRKAEFCIKREIEKRGRGLKCDTSKVFVDNHFYCVGSWIEVSVKRGSPHRVLWHTSGKENAILIDRSTSSQYVVPLWKMSQIKKGEILEIDEEWIK